jgi:hypothetical protein
MVACIRSRLGLLRPADLADHEHRIRVRIVLEQLQDIAEARPVDRIAPMPTDVETPMPSSFIWLAAS